MVVDTTGGPPFSSLFSTEVEEALRCYAQKFGESRDGEVQGLMSLLVEFGPISEPRRMKELCSCMPVTFFGGEGSKSSGFLLELTICRSFFLLAFETHKCRMRIIRCHVISTPIHQNFMQPGWKTHWILDWHERKTIIYICVFQDVSGWDVAKSLGVGKLEKSVCAAQNPAGVLMDFSHAKIY